MKVSLSWIQWYFTFIDDISSNAQCSMAVVTSSRPLSPGGSCLVLSNGLPYGALPRLVQASLGLDPLSAI